MQREVKGFDDVITQDDVDFITSKLRKASLIRLGFLALLLEKDIIGSLGSVSPKRHQKLLQRLADYLTQNAI